MSERIKPTNVTELSSGDQSVFSSWDSLLKLHGYRADGGDGKIHHQFHLADPLGRSNRGIAKPHITQERFRYLNGKEVQPSWFAVTEAWPPFAQLPTVPYKLGEILGEKFETFAKETEKATHALNGDEKASIESAARKMGFHFRLPLTTSGVYEVLTASNYRGIADEGKRSASSYTFDEVEEQQRKVMRMTYTDIAHMASPDQKKGVKDRFKHLTGEDSPYYQAVKGKSFPEAATEVFNLASQEIAEHTGVDLGELELGETATDFRIVTKSGERVRGNERSFVFLNWYLSNRELYDHAHNEISEELTQKGENPIQSLGSGKGETPFWVIVDGQKHKLYLTEGLVNVVRREGNTLHEDPIPFAKELKSDQDVAEVLASHYPGKDVAVMPTAIGLILNFRATSDLLLPEQGSHYIPQVDMVYERMLLSATKEQAKHMLPQKDIVRVHPHALSSLESGKLVRLPDHLAHGFPIDENGFTSTDIIKETWEEVVASQKATLAQAREAETLLEKARILFTNTDIPGVADQINALSVLKGQDEALRQMTGVLTEEVKGELSKAEMRVLGPLSAYMRGLKDERPEGIAAIDNRLAGIEEVRAKYLSSGDTLKKLPAIESSIKLLAALRARQLEASIESLEYFDARSSMMGMYLLFGEEGVSNLIHNAENYVEKTPMPITKAWYSAEGNKIVVIQDTSGENTPTKKRIAHKIAHSLEKDNFDTAMVLTPPSNPEMADFRVDQVCLDGSVGGMCGNGVRSVARYAYDHLGLETVRLETETGAVIEGFFDGELFGARLAVDHLSPESVEMFSGMIDEDTLQNHERVATISEAVQRALHTHEDYGHRFSEIKVHAIASASGEPHIVLSHPQLSNYEVINEAATVINSLQTDKGKKLFPGDINVSFVRNHQSDIEILTHERGGPGITGACGTGAASILSVLQSEGIYEASFKTPAGTLQASFDGTYYVIKGGVDEVI